MFLTAFDICQNVMYILLYCYAFNNKQPEGMPYMTTLKFNNYAAADQFASKSGVLNPTRPYKRTIWKDGVQIIVWCVTLAYGL